MEIRTLEKFDIKHKKTILDLDFLISCNRNSGFPKFLLFKVSNKQRTSKTYISWQKRLINLEINEVRYNCIAHRPVHLSTIAIRSHGYIKRKQPQRNFLHYSCSVTMIDIVKKYL